MSDGAGQAPAGWYNDPHAPGRMRYFDGEVWTNHFHTPGKLPDIGAWLNTTFSVFSDYWQGAAALALGLSLVGNVVVWLGVRAAVGDLALVDDELVNFETRSVVIIGLMALFGMLWQGFGWLSLNRFMQRAHHRANPTIGEAAQRAMRRLPKYIAIYLALILVMILVFAVLFAVGFAAGPIVILLILPLIGFGIWAAVKLAFLAAAIAAVPDGTPILASSAGVSSGRFWPVFGRILLLTIGLAIAANIVSAVTGGLGSPIDQDALTDIFIAEGDTFEIRDFAFKDLLPSTGSLAVFMILSSIIRAASTLVSTSAFMRLYLDSGAPSDI